MAKTLKTNVRPTVSWENRNPLDLGTVVDDQTLAVDLETTSGTGTNQTSIMWKDRRIVTVATTDDELDLAGGLVDVFGATLTFVRIKTIEIINRGEPDGSGGWTETAGEDLLVGGAATDAFDDFLNGVATDQVTIPAGGVLLLTAPVDGWVVAAGTADKLLIAHDGSAGDIEYDIVLTGTDA